MTKEEIKHLGHLSRIKLDDAQVEKFNIEIDAVLEYVSQINEIVAEGELTKTVGPVQNIFREDVITNEPGSYTEVLLDEMPEKEGDLLKVKKILNPEE
ncbi:Asp-tRNA(Asn)/Glu-tRNA(Gln) amidotransferase GatCAB subunit C [bacterium]|nr:Asp-tRNA(Asn)/Glu-tRNA(Gln) amidotransferase GatCAB subunit C [bacterium]|tara:strand:+ start:962 stop:1255 length:294 start_codon:yes stop_codon:yes gene_type:complete